jgi:tellurite resistance protein TerC
MGNRERAIGAHAVLGARCLLRAYCRLPFPSPPAFSACAQSPVPNPCSLSSMPPALRSSRMMVWLWSALAVLMVALIAVEALLLRRARVLGLPPMGPSEAMTGLLFWIVVAVLGFSILIGHFYETNFVSVQALLAQLPLPDAPRDVNNLKGTEAGMQFLTAYATELALSLDNVAVLALLFAYHKVPVQQVSRVLFVGILVSLVLRLALVLLGGWALAAASWFIYVFVALLVVAMLRTLLLPDDRTDFDNRFFGRAIRRALPVTRALHGDALWARETPADAPAGARARWVLTPLGVCVLTAGLADVSYAADSIPAVFSITQDPFLAYAAQAMVILSLRSLYFAVAPVVGRFRFLKLALVFIMGYIVVKTLVFRHSEPAAEVTLAVVTGTLALTVGLSVLADKRRRARLAQQTSTTDEALLEARPSPLDDLAEAALASKRNLRKVAILIAGTAVIIFAIIIAPLPGPGPTVLIPVGVAILATEFVWAKTLFDRGKRIALQITDKSDRVSQRLPRWFAIPALLAFYGFWGALAWFAYDSEPRREKLLTFALFSAGGGSFFMLGWAYRLVFRSGAQRGTN